MAYEHTRKNYAHGIVGRVMHPVFAAALAPPQSEVHRIISEADLLEADRARNVNKAERLTQLAAERDLDQQIQHQDEWGWRK